MINNSLRYVSSFAMALMLLGTGPVFAGRGGFHGGGGGGGGRAVGHVGGGGGQAFRGGAVHPAPSFSAPRTFNNAGNRVGNTNVVGNRGAVVNRETNITNANVNVNRSNHFNNFNGGAGWRGPYSGYHSGWVHGYWNGHYSNGYRGLGYGGLGYGGLGYGGLGYGGLGYGGGLGYWGLGLATGVAAWGLGSSLFNWGYSNYYNPYYAASPMMTQQPVAAQQPPSPYNYAQPINTQGPPPEQSATDAALQVFETARGAFKAGDYNQALTLADQALTTLPNDATLHEFRALVLFATGQYEQAAVPLYAVLTNGPGWDWTTLIGLYPNIDVYTTQLRGLEDFIRQKPDVAAAHFVLAYHYLTQGHDDSAVAQFKKVVALQPGDKLSGQLLRQLAQPSGPDTGGDQPPAQPQPPPQPVASSVPAGDIVGNWSAAASKDTRIALTIGHDGGFVWKVTGQGQDRQFTGTSTYGNGLLTLAQSQGPPMVGHVTWQDADHFTFQVSGGPDDPGLNFAR